MLVLSRKIDEVLRIGRDVTVKVLGIDGDRVKLGIDAPRRITILRDEIEAEGSGEIDADPYEGALGSG